MSDQNGDRQKQPTSFWIDVDTRELLTELTEQLGMSRSAVVREAIRLMHADTSDQGARRAEVRRLVKELSRAVGT